MNFNLVRTLSRVVETKLNGFSREQRAEVAATIVGISIGTYATLPTAAVSNLDQYTKDAVAYFNKFVGKLNESYVLDVSQVISTAVAVYKHRYQMVYNPEAYFDLLSANDFIETLGLSKRAEDVVKNIERSSLFEFYVIVKQIAEELNKEA